MTEQSSRLNSAHSQYTKGGPRRSPNRDEKKQASESSTDKRVVLPSFNILQEAEEYVNVVMASQRASAIFRFLRVANVTYHCLRSERVALKR